MERLKDLRSLRYEELIDLRKVINGELKKREEDYLKLKARDAEITDEEVDDIIQSRGGSYSLPLSDYAKVILALSAERARFDLEEKGMARLWPLVGLNDPDKEFKIS